MCQTRKDVATFSSQRLSVCYRMRNLHTPSSTFINLNRQNPR